MVECPHKNREPKFLSDLKYNYNKGKITRIESMSFRRTKDYSPKGEVWGLRLLKLLIQNW